MCIIPLYSFSQTQTFNSQKPTTGELGFTGDGGYFNQTGGTFTTDNTGAYGVKNGNNGNGGVNTTTLAFGERTFQVNSGTSSSPNTLTFDLANPVADFDTKSKIEVYLNVNRKGFTATPQLTILPDPTGNPPFNFIDKPVNRTTDYNTTTSVSMIGGSYINKVTINLPSSSTAGTRVAVTIILTAGSKKANTLLVDNVALTSGNSSTTLVASGSSLPLPVELLHFDATVRGQNVNINWATASEKNNDHFDLQRSTTGDIFETIGNVKGQGNSITAHDYAFVDSRPLAGLSYYRLRQVDTDGSSDYSPVATVKSAASLKAIAFPNPTTGTITLPTLDGPVQYRIYNNVGQTLLSGQAIGNEQFDITKIPRGTFFLELASQSGRTTQRLVRE